MIGMTGIAQTTGITTTGIITAEMTGTGIMTIVTIGTKGLQKK
jgi:hypothetical protein